MALTQLDIQGYRSLRNVRLPLERLNVITGPNGSGKSNLYRALWLISQIAEGDFARAMCREGGLLSAMWAGPRSSAKKALRMVLGFRAEELSFELSCGFPPPSMTAFGYDPEIKEEAVWCGPKRKPTSLLLERAGGMTWVRDLDGRRIEYPLMLDDNESVLTQLREPHRYPELSALREEVRGWRFYHTLRTDEDAHVRSPRTSVRTPVLSANGSDLAAALQTILESSKANSLHEAIASALPGRTLTILANEPEPFGKSPRYTELTVALHTEGCARPLLARELSDGTIKFLYLAAALLSPRPPELIAINEPEASLHPDLIAALARLIVDASRMSQVWITTHSQPLAQEIEALSGVQPIRLQLDRGETVLDTDDR
jgi:predicted ATPase